jgi:hypothetical protein
VSALTSGRPLRTAFAGLTREKMQTGCTVLCFAVIGLSPLVTLAIVAMAVLGGGDR